MMLLKKAEELLQHVAQISPSANTKLWRGRIALRQGDQKSALELLRGATVDRPESAFAAADFLLASMSALTPPAKHAEVSEPFAKKFPKNGEIVSLHAVSLSLDDRHDEAKEVYARAMSIDPTGAKRLPPGLTKFMDEARFYTPAVRAGLDAFKANKPNLATSAFRKAVQEDPNNPVAARRLSSAIAFETAQRFQRGDRKVHDGLDQIRAVLQRFPNDPEILAPFATVLHFSGDDIAASEVLARLDKGELHAEAFMGPLAYKIREASQEQTRQSFWRNVIQIGLIGLLGWTVLMFILGILLAVAIPRTPYVAMGFSGTMRSRRELWLERFYLVFLSIGLIVFYLTVPFVAMGLFFVTLCLFGLMLACRVIHFGVLHRGFWATWNVVRSVFMGPSTEIIGIEATEATHPRLLEASLAVADRLKTRPVDAIYLTPSSQICVVEEGAGPFGLLGKRRRVLQIGISTLPHLTTREFKSILAHEYGHFSHNDTFYSRFIFQVSASLATSLAVMNAAGGWLNYINPFHWFWWCYLKAYTLLATGFSRSREFLADRCAANAYGNSAFVSGLTKISVDCQIVDSLIYSNVTHFLSQGRQFTNAFEVARQHAESTEVSASRVQLHEELRRSKPKWFDTHPTLSERIASVADFQEPNETNETDPAFDLLNQPAEVEAKLTQILTHHLFERLHSEQ